MDSLVSFLVTGRWNHRIFEGAACALVGLIATISWQRFWSTRSPNNALKDRDVAFDVEGLSIWVENKRVSLSAVEHQDGLWVIAYEFTHVDLLPLLQLPKAIRSRRDLIIHALVIQLECLLDPNETNEPYDESSASVAIVELTQFAKDNWEEIRRMGLGDDSDTFVVRHITGT